MVPTLLLGDLLYSDFLFRQKPASFTPKQHLLSVGWTCALWQHTDEQMNTSIQMNTIHARITLVDTPSLQKQRG